MMGCSKSKPGGVPGKELSWSVRLLESSPSGEVWSQLSQAHDEGSGHFSQVGVGKLSYEWQVSPPRAKEGQSWLSTASELQQVWFALAPIVTWKRASTQTLDLSCSRNADSDIAQQFGSQVAVHATKIGMDPIAAWSSAPTWHQLAAQTLHLCALWNHHRPWATTQTTAEVGSWTQTLPLAAAAARC